MKKIIATIFLLVAAADAENIVHYDKSSLEQIVFKPYHPISENVVSGSKGQAEEVTFKPYFPNVDNIIHPARQ